MFHVSDKYSLALLTIFPERKITQKWEMFHVSDKYSLALQTVFPEENHSSMRDVPRVWQIFPGAANHFPEKNNLNMRDVLCAWQIFPGAANYFLWGNHSNMRDVPRVWQIFPGAVNYFPERKITQKWEIFHVSDKYSLALLSVFPEENHSSMRDGATRLKNFMFCSCCWAL